MVQENEQQLIEAGPELRKKLPRGAIREIANELGISWVWAHRVITGRSEGDAQIIALANAHAKLEESKRKKLTSLMENFNKELEEID